MIGRWLVPDQEHKTFPTIGSLFYDLLAILAKSIVFVITADTVGNLQPVSIIHRVCLMQKSHGGRDWLDAAVACQLMANRPPCDFRFVKARWIMSY